jgi:8-oxo-dGTP diphosphatase
MTGEPAWVPRYDPSRFRPFAVTVDLAVFTLRDDQLCVLLVRRGEHPYRGWWALPGGHLHQGRESAEVAARRELREETGVDSDAAGVHLEQLATYSDPQRDPRIAAGLQVVSIAYVALAPDLPDPVAGTDARRTAWWAVGDALRQRLAFDHGAMLGDAVERVRARLEYTTLATRFVKEPFSLADLRNVYLAVWGQAPNVANFRRKVLATPDFVRPTARVAEPTHLGGRPAELYIRGSAHAITPALTRRE